MSHIIYTTQRWMAFSVLFAIFRAFLAVDSKLIANFATRTLKNLENEYEKIDSSY